MLWGQEENVVAARYFGDVVIRRNAGKRGKIHIVIKLKARRGEVAFVVAWIIILNRLINRIGRVI